jgi:protein-S-isoprenylcysteine O-methyltransferase Ste14
MRIAILLLALCWLIFLVFWVVMARGAKQSLRPGQRGKQWAYALILVIGIGLIVASWSGWPGAGRSSWLNAPLWPFSIWRAALALVIAYAGLAICIWARIILGRNWSSIPELKRDHELVTGGPYEVVRHPIYTGLLLMFTGVAVLWATPASFIVLLLIPIAIQLKLAREETLLAGQFPDTWPAYRARTRRVIPLLW